MGSSIGELPDFEITDYLTSSTGEIKTGYSIEFYVADEERETFINKYSKLLDNIDIPESGPIPAYIYCET